MGALSTDELLASVFGQNGHGYVDARHLLTTFEGWPGLAAANMLMPEMGLLDQEELRVILLDTRNRVLTRELSCQRRTAAR